MALIILMISQAASAEVIKSKMYFKQYGRFAPFVWGPERYTNKFKYDGYYFIPHKLKDQTKVKALIFLHGGGVSTRTRSGSLNVIQDYRSKMTAIAEQLGVVLVMPSSSGAQWGAHTRGMLRDLAQLMRAELDVDPNMIGVSGHSMGGMAITRVYNYGADEFAFYMPMAAGIDTSKTWLWNDEFVSKVFNVPYLHVQGINDIYSEFVTRSQDHEKKVKELEVEYGLESKFKLYLFDGGHDLNQRYTKENLELLFKTPRNLYQKNLFGTLYTANFMRTENGVSLNQDSEPRYFWVELLESDLSQEETTHFTAKVVGQDIYVDMPVIPKMSKRLRLYLSERMLDLNSPIKIHLNGTQIKVIAENFGTEKNMDSRDAGFVFNGHVDISLD